MPDTVRITFLFALGDCVRYGTSPWPWTIVQRQYHEGTLARSIRYGLAHTEFTPEDSGVLAYEADLKPWEDA